MVKKEIKVLVVDDSAFMRKTIKELLESDYEIKVIDTAKNGQDAIDKLNYLKPDIVTLDIHMPIMNGRDALEIIMKKYPLPVIIISSLTQEDAPLALELLDIGAFDYVPKPGGTISLNIKKIQEEMITKVKKAYLYRKHINQRDLPLNRSFTHNLPSTKKYAKYVVVIGISTGGPTTMVNILQKVKPPDDNIAYLVAQHMPIEFTKSLAQRLNSVTPIPFKHANNGEAILGGYGYICPGNWHTKITSNMRVKLFKDDKFLYYPSIDILMDSVAEVYAPNAIGVILTGIGKDGAQGLLKMRQKGCYTIAESKESAVIYGMPKEADKIGAAQIVQHADNIHIDINRFINRLS